MSTFGFPQYETRRGPGHFAPARGAPPAVFTPMRVAAPNYAPVSSGWRALPNMQRQPERHERHHGGWRAQPPAPQITNNYYTQPAALAPIAPVQPVVATTTPVPTTVVAPSMPAPQPDISPGNSTADMGPTQDAAAAASDASLPPASPGPGQPGEHPVHSIGRKVIIGLVVAGVAFGGYKLYQKHKKGGGHAKPHHGMQGFRRRRRARR